MTSAQKYPQSQTLAHAKPKGKCGLVGCLDSGGWCGATSEVLVCWVWVAGPLPVPVPCPLP